MVRAVQFSAPASTDHPLTHMFRPNFARQSTIRSVVIGVLHRGPVGGDEDVRLPQNERAAADLFFEGSGNFMRDLERERAAERGIQLPLYPTRRNVLTALEGLHERCATEFGRHFAFPRPLSDLRPIGEDSTYTGVLESRMPYETTLLDGSDRKFLKLGPMHELRHWDAETFASVVELVDAIEANPQDSKQIIEQSRDAVLNAQRIVTSPIADILEENVVAVLVWRLIRALDRAGLHKVVRDVFYDFFDRLEVKGTGDLVALATPLFEKPIDYFDAIDMHDHTGVFAHELNTETINEISAAQRVTALVRAGISPGFTPMFDYFFCNVADILPGGGAMVGVRGPVTQLLGVFMVHATNPQPLSHLYRMHPEVTPAGVGVEGMFADYLQTLTATLAHVLLALEAAQHHIQFVHYDAHELNVMLLPVHENSEVTRFQFRRPANRGEFFIPLNATQRHLVRFIDFGRSRVAHPHDHSDVCWAQIGTYSTPRFDQVVDMRMFAFELVDVALLRTGWLPDLLNTNRTSARLGRVSENFLDVLDAIIGMDQWESLQSRRAPPFWAVMPTGLDRTEEMEFLRIAPIGSAPPRSFRDFLRLVQMTGAAPADMRNFRDREIAPTREDWVEGAGRTPADVLELPLFDFYRRPPSSGVTVDFIGDATREIPRQE